MVSPAVEAVLTWNLRQWSSSEFCLTGGSAEGRGPFRLETLDLEFRVFLEQEGHLLTCSLTEEGTKGGFNGPWMHVAADSVGFDCGSGDDAAVDYDDDDGDCMKQKATMMRPA